MRVLITGATGFVGSALAEHLRSEGHVATGLSRGADRARRDARALSEVWSWDPMSGPPPEPALAEADAVVNLAGESVFGLWTDEKKRRIYDSRITTTRHLVDGIRRAPKRPSVLVSSSAMGYYGDRGDEQLVESAPPGEGFLADLCRDWESEADRARALGVRVVRLRSGLVLHGSGGPLEPMSRAFRLCLGGRLGSGNQFWSWIHREDLLRLITHALEHPVSGALNATSPGPVRNADFTRTLAGVLGRPAILPVPRPVLGLMGGFSTELLSSRRVLPEATTASGFAFRHPALEGALRDALGLRAG
jgi:uncharacterized protein (TIGR01777 family)